MKKTWKLIISGLLLISIAGCGSKDNSKADVKIESQSTAETQLEKKEVSKSESKDERESDFWVNLGFDGEINVNALPELAENWWESSNRVYIPLRYTGKQDGDKPYCYLYWDALTDIYEFEPPKDIYGLPDFFYKKTNGWFDFFAKDVTLNTNYNGKIQMDIDDQKVLTINNADFLRVEGTVRSVNEDNPEADKSQRYIAYYGLLVPQEEAYIYKDNVKMLAENAQVVFIMGDTSEAQDKFEDVCKIADSIMSTYRIKEK